MSKILEYGTLKMNGKNYVLVPEKQFEKIKKIESKTRVSKKNDFPKTYTEIDEEGIWETIDFGPEGISAKDLVLLHKAIENDRKI